MISAIGYVKDESFTEYLTDNSFATIINIAQFLGNKTIKRKKITNRQNEKYIKASTTMNTVAPVSKILAFKTAIMCDCF